MIAFDFDGVIFNMGPVIDQVAVEMYGRESTGGEIHCYDLENAYGLTTEEVQAMIPVVQEDRFLLAENFIYGAQRILSELGNGGGWPIIIITARPRTEPVREFLLEHLKIDPRRLKVAFSHSKDKGVLAYQMGIDTFVDDYYVSLLSIMQWGIQPILFDQPWNRVLPSDRSHAYSCMERVLDWRQLERRLLDDTVV